MGVLSWLGSLGGGGTPTTPATPAARVQACADGGLFQGMNDPDLVQMLRGALAEIALIAPPELRATTERVAAQVGQEHGLDEHRVYLSQQGRGTYVEIVYHVPTGLPPRPLEEWDAIRAQLRDELAGDDPHYLISVMFTTSPPPDQALADA